MMRYLTVLIAAALVVVVVLLQKPAAAHDPSIIFDMLTAEEIAEFERQAVAEKGATSPSEAWYDMIDLATSRRRAMNKKATAAKTVATTQAKAQDCPTCKRQPPPLIGVVTTRPQFPTPIRTGIHYLLTPRGYYEIRWYVPSGRYQVLGVVPPPTIQPR